MFIFFCKEVVTGNNVPAGGESLSLREENASFDPANACHTMHTVTHTHGGSHFLR